MAWDSSRRVVPGDWRSRRARCLRDHEGVCHVCGHPDASEVDHLVNVAAGGTHEPENLAPIHGGACPWCGRRCHIEKTSREGQAARRQNRDANREAHPGLIR